MYSSQYCLFAAEYAIVNMRRGFDDFQVRCKAIIHRRFLISFKLYFTHSTLLIAYCFCFLSSSCICLLMNCFRVSEFSAMTSLNSIDKTMMMMMMILMMIIIMILMILNQTQSKREKLMMMVRGLFPFLSSFWSSFPL